MKSLANSATKTTSSTIIEEESDKADTNISLKELAKIDPNRALSQLSIKYASKKREAQKFQTELNDV